MELDLDLFDNLLLLYVQRIQRIIGKELSLQNIRATV